MTLPEVLYIPYTKYSHEQTSNIITFANFEERNLLKNELADVSDKKSRVNQLDFIGELDNLI